MLKIWRKSKRKIYFHREIDERRMSSAISFPAVCLNGPQQQLSMCSSRVSANIVKCSFNYSNEMKWSRRISFACASVSNNNEPFAVLTLSRFFIWFFEKFTRNRKMKTNTIGCPREITRFGNYSTHEIESKRIEIDEIQLNLWWFFFFSNSFFVLWFNGGTFGVWISTRRNRRWRQRWNAMKL